MIGPASHSGRAENDQSTRGTARWLDSSVSLRVGLDTLRANPLRTVLSTLGVIMGVTSLVAVLSLGDGMAKYAREQIERTTDLQSISIVPVAFRVVDGRPVPRSDTTTLTTDDADSVTAVIGSSGSARLVVTGSAVFTTPRDTTPHLAQVTGLAVRGLADIAPIVAGRAFTDAEAKAAAPVAIVSTMLATQIAHGRPAASVVGDTLRFAERTRTIIGVLGEAPAASGPVAAMPIGAARPLLSSGIADRPVTIVVKANRIEDVPSIRVRLEHLMERRLGASWRSDVMVTSNQSRVDQARQGMLVFKLFMGALTGISLLVGGVGIMNVMLASVTERTREIGIRKATGARQQQVLAQFLFESIVICAFGSLIGIAIGVGAAFSVTGVMRRYTAARIYAGFSVSTFLVGVSAAVLVGLVFGLYPAKRAARLSPIEAIRHE